MTRQRITERFAFTGGKVKRPGVDGFTGPEPVIEGVLLCGFESKNARRYLKTTFEGDRINVYEGAINFLNHGKNNAARDYQEKISITKNRRHNAAGQPIGDLHVNPKHPYAEAFLHDAEHNPGVIGMSHVAECETTRGADGVTEVTRIIQVESVDVVIGPATTKGLYEQEGRAVSITLKEYREQFNRLPKATSKQIRVLRRLAEMGPGMDAIAMPEAPGAAADAEPEDGVSAAVKAAAQSEIDECMSKASSPEAIRRCLKRLRKILGLHGGLDGDDDGGGDDEFDDDEGDGGGDDEGEGGKKKKKEESRRPTIATLTTEAKAAGLANPTVADLETLSEIPTAAARKRVAESLAKRAAPDERPQSGRPAPAPQKKQPLTEQAADPNAPLWDTIGTR